MCLGGDWEVQAWYMRGTCVVQVTPGPGKAFPRRRSQGRDETLSYKRRSRTGAAKFNRYSGATELGSCIKSTGLALFQTESHFRRAEGPKAVCTHLGLRGAVAYGNWWICAREDFPPAAGRVTQRANHHESSDTRPTEGGCTPDPVRQIA